MSKIIINNSKKLEIVSNGGRYKLIAKMKVDYDAVNDIFGARDWIFKVIDLSKKQNVNLQKKSENVFKKTKYQYKKELLKEIEMAECFSDAILEINNKTH